MIITRLQGGLGNQMFQYAIARKLSIKNKDVFKLDLSFYTPGNKRSFDLNGFKIVENIATTEDIRRVKLPYGSVSRLMIEFKTHVLRIFNIGYVPSVLEKKGDIYLDGFWQDERYFADIRETILSDFALKDQLTGAPAMVLEKIKNTDNSVSLHVRRGDYVGEKVTNAYWGTCGSDYYNRAIAILKKNIDSFTLFVFSDDIAWVKENLPFDVPVIYVSGYNTTNCQELTLMAACDHNVIANSSFSWWAAWLNQNPDKVVVAPKRWQLKSPNLSKDIVPNSWIRT